MNWSAFLNLICVGSYQKRYILYQQSNSISALVLYILYFLLDMVQSIAEHAVKQTVTAFKMQKWILISSKCAFHHGHYACSSC